jgi:hypothetical protein
VNQVCSAQLDVREDLMNRALIQVTSVKAAAQGALRALRAAFIRRPTAFAAGAVVATAAVVRLVHVNYGLPHLYFWDEEMVINAAREMIIAGRLWPESFYRYPSLLIDLQVLVSVPAYFKALKSYSAFVDFGDIPIHYFVLNGRLVTVAFGVAGVVLTYLFASRIWRRPWWGVAGAALLAIAGFNVMKSRMIAVDAPMATLALASCYFLFRFRAKGSLKHLLWSGAFLGMAVGAKYNAAYFVPAAVLALACWRRPAREFAFWGLTVAGVFLLTTPGALFRLNHLVTSLGENYHHYKTAGDELFVSGAPLLGAGLFLFTREFTYLPTVFAALGLGVVVWRWRLDGLLFVAFLASFELAVAGMAIWTPELVVNVLPFVALFAAAGLGAFAEFVGAKMPGRGRAVAVAVVIAAFFALPVIELILDLRAWSLEDPRTKGAAWVSENVPWPSAIVKEVWHKWPLVKGGETDNAPIDEGKYKIIRTEFITQKTLERWASRRAIYYVGHFPRGRFARRARLVNGAFAGVTGDLEDYWRHFEIVAHFPCDPRRPWPVTIYRFDDNLLVKAHPYRREIELRKCLAVREGPPHEPLGFGRGWFSLFHNGRVGCFFTAPAGSYRLGFKLRGQPANDIPPRVRVWVDNKKVADFAVTKAKVYWTKPIAPYACRYRHVIMQYYNDTVDLAGADRNVFLGGIYVEAVK